MDAMIKSWHDGRKEVQYEAATIRLAFGFFEELASPAPAVNAAAYLPAALTSARGPDFKKSGTSFELVRAPYKLPLSPDHPLQRSHESAV
ncbi:MAG: hypothetical protein ACK40A_18960 [Pannonibacter indicus]